MLRCIVPRAEGSGIIILYSHKLRDSDLPLGVTVGDRSIEMRQCSGNLLRIQEQRETYSFSHITSAILR